MHELLATHGRLNFITKIYHALSHAQKQPSPQDFLNQEQNKGRSSSKSKSRNKKNKNKNMTCVRQESNKILLQEQNKAMTKKRIQN
jgi:hypothetical protein